MVRLFIEKNTTTGEWVELELSDDEQLQFSFIRSDVNDIQNRNSSFSQNIEIIGTSKNRKAFEHIYNIDKYINDIDKIYINKNFNCQYEIDGIPFQGYFELESIGKTNYDGNVIFNCYIKGNTILIKDKIGDKYLINNVDELDDLDFSEYTHQFTGENISDSWNATAGSGYYYPIMNNINYGTSDTILMDSLRPALYGKEVLDKIFEKAGLTYTSNFLNSTEFKKVIHPWCGKSETDPDELELRQFRAGLSSNWETTRSGGPWVTNRVILDDDNEPDPFNFYDNGGNYFVIGSSYKVPVGGMYEFSFLGRMTPVWSKFFQNGFNFLESGISKISIAIRVERSGTSSVLASENIKYQPASQNFLVANRSTTRIYDDPITVTLTTDEVQLYEDDRVYVTIHFNNNTSWANTLGQEIDRARLSYLFLREYSGNPATIFQNRALQANKIFLGEMVDPTRSLPQKVKQYDYFKSILNLFNLIINEDPLDPYNFIIEPRVDLVGSGQRLDWTYKMDNNEIINITRVETLVDKNVQFSYKLDKDFYNDDYFTSFEDDYGNYRKLNIVNTEDDYEISVIFSQTPHNYHNDSKVILPQMYKLKDDGTVIDSDFNMRILYRTDIDLENDSDFDSYTDNEEFKIYLRGDIAGPYQYFYMVTNIDSSLIFSISNNIFRTLHTANHFENPYVGDTNDLNFGYQNTYYVPTPNPFPTSNNLYNRFWSDYIENIMDINSKIIKLTVKLSAKEIKDISFDDIIIYSGQEWVINRIDNWVNNQLTEVELLKIS